MKNLALFILIGCVLVFVASCSSQPQPATRNKSRSALHPEQQAAKTEAAANQTEAPSPQEAARPTTRYSAPVYSEPESAYIPPRRSTRAAAALPAPARRPARNSTYSTAVHAPVAPPSPPTYSASSTPTYSGSAQAPSSAQARPAEPEPVPLPESGAAVGQSSPDLRRTQRQEEILAQQPEPVPAPPPREERVTIPAGTELTIRTLDRISSEDGRPGERFAAMLDTDVYQNNKLVIPANTEVTGHIVSVQEAGRMGGRAELVMELESINIGGQPHNLRTSKLTMKGENKAKEDAAKIGGGAAIGAVLGAITGGKKGAIIGATVGAGTGTAGAVMSKGKPLRIGPESRLRFRLEAPLEVVVR